MTTTTTTTATRHIHFVKGQTIGLLLCRPGDHFLTLRFILLQGRHLDVMHHHVVVGRRRRGVRDIVIVIRFGTVVVPVTIGPYRCGKRRDDAPRIQGFPFFLQVLVGMWSPVYHSPLSWWWWWLREG